MGGSEHGGRASDGPWFERVRFVLLDEQGRLASEPVTITPEGASAMPSDWLDAHGDPGGLGIPIATSLWVDGDDAVTVSYASLGDEHDGIFTRQVQCEPMTTE